jgi:hypothetical protein
MQRAWIIVGSIVTVVVLAGATLNAVGLVAREEVTVTDEVDAAGLVAIDVQASTGSVEVVGTDTDVIRLEVELTHGLRRTGHRAEV